jgi:hypothetical protein
MHAIAEQFVIKSKAVGTSYDGRTTIRGSCIDGLKIIALTYRICRVVIPEDLPF